jgi:hypothetical protein
MPDLNKFYEAEADYKNQIEELKAKIATLEGEIQLRESRVQDLESQRRGALGAGEFDRATELAAQKARVETEVEGLTIQKAMAEEALEDRLSVVAEKVMDVARELLVEVEPELRASKAELEKLRDKLSEKVQAVRKRCAEVQGMAQSAAIFGAMNGVTGTNPGFPNGFYYFSGQSYAPKLGRGTVPRDVTVPERLVYKRPGAKSDSEKAEQIVQGQTNAIARHNLAARNRAMGV